MQINLESLHCRERARDWRESRREGRGEKDREKEEIKRQRAERNIKRGVSVNRRKRVMNRGGRSE